MMFMEGLPIALLLCIGVIACHSGDHAEMWSDVCCPCCVEYSWSDSNKANYSLMGIFIIDELVCSWNCSKVCANCQRHKRLHDGETAISSKSHLSKAFMVTTMSAMERLFFKEVLDNVEAEESWLVEKKMCADACGDARLLEVEKELFNFLHKTDLHIDKAKPELYCKPTEELQNNVDIYKTVLLTSIPLLMLFLLYKQYSLLPLKCCDIQIQKDATREDQIDENVSCENMNCSPKGKTDDEQRLSWRFIFDFHCTWMVTLTVHPFTLNQYVNEIVNDNREPNELMKYEWSRYLSFKNFPQDSKVTPMRLAQAGFYSTGNGEEVQCFSCGVKNHVWSDEESVWQAHRRLSPSCNFICGDSSDNVPIHGPDYYTTMGQN